MYFRSSRKGGAVGQEMETDQLEQDLDTKLSLTPQPGLLRPNVFVVWCDNNSCGVWGQCVQI